jgi:hypothetical protein
MTQKAQAIKENKWISRKLENFGLQKISVRAATVDYFCNFSCLGDGIGRTEV